MKVFLDDELDTTEGWPQRICGGSYFLDLA